MGKHKGTTQSQFFTSASYDSGIKQRFNDLTTKAREKKVELYGWLVQQHAPKRHAEETADLFYHSFEKSIGQHINPKNPLNSKELAQRDHEFLLNVQCLLMGWVGAY